MITGHFYFIKDEFYEKLSDCRLMANKEKEEDFTGGRPCHYCYKKGDYYWMIPISSQVEKFRKIYNSKCAKRGYCDSIRFGYVYGRECAFLIQNCFPVIEKYIAEEYKTDNNTVPVTISKELSHELNQLVNKVIRMYKKGIVTPLTKIDRIIDYLNEGY